VSFYGLPEDNSIGNVLSGITEFEPGVLGEGFAANYVNGQWLGTMQTIDSEDGYWIKISGNAELNVEGLPIAPSTVYTLHDGTNLISYPFAGFATLTETIPEDAQSSIIGIIGEGESAMNYDGVWVGGLTNLSGTEGYWFITSEDVEFTYNAPASGDYSTRQAKTRKMLPEAYTFAQSTQQAFYFVKSVEIDGIPLDVNDLIIAYNGDVVVGARYWYGETTDVPAMGTDGIDLHAGFGASGDKITFKVLDASTNSLIDMKAEGETAWKDFGMSIINLTDKIIPEEITFSAAYPNPFNPATQVQYAIPEDIHVELKIFDVQGRLVAELVNTYQQAGYHKVMWNGNLNSSGIYFMKLTAGEYIKIQKLMLVK